MSIRASYPVVVDRDRDIARILRDDAYLTFISGVILRQIPVGQKGVEHIVVDVMQAKSTSSSSGMLWSMNAHLRRPSDIIELLHFGEQYPEVQQQVTIIALGTVIELGNARYVFGLSMESAERVLRLFPFASEWPVEFGFLCSRK